MTLKTIVEEAGKLSPAERETLIEELLCMGENGNVDSLTPEQAADLDRRIDEYEQGKVEMFDGPEVMKRLRERR